MKESKFTKTLWTSKKQNYNTPSWLFHKLNSYYDFITDPCTSEDNPLGCEIFFTKKSNGLDRKKWGNGNVFINPEYKNIREWVQEAYQFFCRTGNTVVLLLPSRTGNRVYQDLIFPNASLICFIRGRLKFDDAENSAPFDSALIIFNKNITFEEKNLYRDIGSLVTVD